MRQMKGGEKTRKSEANQGDQLGTNRRAYGRRDRTEEDYRKRKKTLSRHARSEENPSGENSELSRMKKADGGG